MKKLITLSIMFFNIYYVDAQMFEWVAHLYGSTNTMVIRDIKVDLVGNVYSIGYFRQTIDADPGPGTFNMTSLGNEDVLIVKLNAYGNFIWAKQIGNQQNDFGNSLVLDHNGNLYLTGSVGSTVDFDPGPGTFNLSSFGERDVFILKLDTAGNFVWAKRIGGSGTEEGNSITIDYNLNIHVVGNYGGTSVGVGGYTVDFDPGPGVNNLITIGLFDCFVLKIDTAANFVWAKSIGGPNADYSFSVVVDDDGNVYHTGFFRDSLDFDPGPGNYNLISYGNEDAFITKLDVNGNFLWAKSIGGISNDRSYSIDINQNNSQIYVTGFFQNTVDFDPGLNINNISSNGMEDFFILNLDSSGNYVWSVTTGGFASEIARELHVDLAGNIYVTGYFYGNVDFDPGPGVSLLSSTLDNQGNATYDIFLSKYNSSGGLIYSLAFGGEIAGFTDTGTDIYADDNFNIYSTGYFNGTVDFDPGPATVSATGVGNGNGYILKLTQCTPPSLTTSIIDPLCHGSTGSATVTPIGNAPFTYLWSNGQTTQTATGLPAGTHTVTVTDDSSCAAIATVTITQPAQIISNVSSTATNYISPNCNGSVSINPTGGTPPYNITWSSGTINNLCQGWYTATITDANNCVVTDSVYVNFIVGVDEINNSAITVSPNPTTGKVKITSNDKIGELKVFDVSGKLILQQLIESSEDEIDLSDLERGIYFLENKRLQFKIIKQ